MNELIVSLEGNFQRYSEILYRIGENTNGTDYPQHSYQVKDMLCTLADLQSEVINFRLKKILKEENPYLPQIRIKRVRQRNPHQRDSVAQLAQAFLAQRKELLQLLHTLPIGSWERTGVHEVEGHVSFREFVRRMVEKDNQMISDLSQMLVAVEHS